MTEIYNGDGHPLNVVIVVESLEFTLTCISDSTDDMNAKFKIPNFYVYYFVTSWQNEANPVI